MALVECPECNEEVSEQAMACPQCGFPLSPFMRRKNRSIAILLAIFLGSIGIHRFYLNQPGMGVLYILFSWTFIPAFVSLIEAILFLFTDEETFQLKYAA